jgi:carbon-monoxide dehydrogenase small subunit
MAEESSMEDEEMEIAFRLNGQAVRRRIPNRLHAVDVLREIFGLSGPRVACEHGVCGACTLRVDNEIVRGCLLLAPQLEDADVWTIEGLTATGEIADLQAEFHARNAMQCGWCTAGMLITAAEILDVPAPMDRQAIREQLSGNYCRCTGYQAIVDAVEATQAKRSMARPSP